MEEEIKTSLEYLSVLCLENSDNKSKYTDSDLINATIILQEVLINKLHDFHSPTLSNERMCILAEEAGKNLRQTILLATGIDLHEAVEGKRTYHS